MVTLPGANCLGRGQLAEVLQSSPGALLLTMLHPSSLMPPQLYVNPAPGQKDPRGGSALGCLEGMGNAEKRNGSKWDEVPQG